MVSEIWWETIRTSTLWTLVNHTLITAYVSSWPGTTTTRYKIDVQTTSASFIVTAEVGKNPISLFNNAGPRPSEVTKSVEGTALVTGGATM